MKRKILSLMFFGSLLIAAMPQKANAVCVRGTMSCGVETLACGNSAQEIAEDLLASDAVFCETNR